jgi:hypothetical protein
VAVLRAAQTVTVYRFIAATHSAFKIPNKVREAGFSPALFFVSFLIS